MPLGFFLRSFGSSPHLAVVSLLAFSFSLSLAGTSVAFNGVFNTFSHVGKGSSLHNIVSNSDLTD
jgi:hypothetical protein